jgi:hypothetical protein
LPGITGSSRAHNGALELWGFVYRDRSSHSFDPNQAGTARRRRGETECRTSKLGGSKSLRPKVLGDVEIIGLGAEMPHDLAR